jgi:uncharacterized protein (TIGR02569 family)
VVLHAFGCQGRPVPLPGGRGTSWRVDGAVLKPLDMSPELLAWQADLLPRLEQHRSAFRVSVPLHASDGGLVVQGWTAWRYEPGSHRPEAWREILAVGRDLAEALLPEPPPPGLADRDDQWAVADRVAWGETDAAVAAGTPHLERLLGARRPVDAPAQLIHADLANNVLFAEGRGPAVIDLSLAWRPAAFAEAVARIDLAVYGGAPLAVATAASEELGQHLVRALLFRLVAEHLGGADAQGVEHRYEAVVQLVTSAA